MKINHGSDLKRGMHKQLNTYKRMLRAEDAIIRVIEGANGTVLRATLAKKIAEEVGDIRRVFRLNGTYLEMVIGDRKYKTSNGTLRAIKCCSWDFHIVVDERGRIASAATVELIKEEFQTIRDLFEEMSSQKRLIDRSNREWEAIKERIVEYRLKYPSFLTRSDIY